MIERRIRDFVRRHPTSAWAGIVVSVGRLLHEIVDFLTGLTGYARCIPCDMCVAAGNSEQISLAIP
jgi:hypothetical protein